MIYPGWNTGSGGLSDRLHRRRVKVIIPLLQKLYRKTSAGSATCHAPFRIRQSRLKPLQRAGLALPWCSFNQKLGFIGMKPAEMLSRQSKNGHVQYAVQESAW